jgi:hypothetical protein
MHETWHAKDFYKIHENVPLEGVRFILKIKGANIYAPLILN